MAMNEQTFNNSRNIENDIMFKSAILKSKKQTFNKWIYLFIVCLLIIGGIQTRAVYATAEEDFESLLFGSGAWIGLLLVMIASVVLIAISKYTAVFVVIIIIMLEVEYFNRLDMYGNYIWHMIILMFFALFIVIVALTDKIKK